MFGIRCFQSAYHLLSLRLFSNIMLATSAKVVLRVDSATARAYREASDDVKERARSAFELALSEKLEEAREEAATELISVMDEIGREAKARGLTEEKLEALLQEIDEERDAELGIESGAKGGNSRDGNAS